MPSQGIRLGVDFGTSNTVAVVRWPDGRSRTLLFDGSPLLPSAVYAEPNALVVGRDAVHSARMDPARFEPNPKRRIDEGTVLLGDRELPVGELIAAVLRRVEFEWRRTVGGAQPECSLTFPASWGATRRLILADAALGAGLGRVRLVPEPVAAAAYFTQVLGREVPIGSVVVVHDFGAGTFDASVVARTSSGFEVLAVDGRDDIGGIDVDNAIVAHVGTIAAEHDAALWARLMQPSTVEDRRARRMLWDDARVAKERLSRQPAADLTVPLLNLDIHLTREELERLAQPLLEQTVRVTQGVMRWAKASEGRVAGVFLVGGSSRIPLVATMLHRSLGSAPVAIEQPELVVAEGSLVGGADAIPVGAGPAPGPATGVLPKIDINQFPTPGLGKTPVSSGSNTPVPSGAAAEPVSGDGPLWPAMPGPASDPPIPVSGSGAYQGPPDLRPVSGLPASGSPVQGFSTPAAPGPGGPARGPVHGGQSAPPAPSRPAVAPFSPPVSGMPVSGTPASGPPVSSPPDRSAGRVFISGSAPVSPGVGHPVSPPVRPPANPPPRPIPPAPPRPPVNRPPVYYQPVHQPQPLPPPPPPQVVVVYRDRRSAGGRFISAFMLIVLLVAVPLAAGYIAYYLTTGVWPPPPDTWFG